MGTPPLFSIITVCRNDLPRLHDTAASIRRQTFKDWEWVVVDGASSDGTSAYLETRPLENMIWKSEPDRGIYDGFNKAAALSTGQILIYICAGDLLTDPDVLQRTADFIAKNPSFDIYYGDANELYDDGSRFLRAARSHTWVWYSQFTHHQSIFYRRRCFDLAQYREEHAIGGDYTFTAELLHKGATAVQMPIVVADFPVGGHSYRNYWQGEWDNWRCRRDILDMSWPTCAAILAVHGAVRVGRLALPGVYRQLRYAGRAQDQQA
ncbi:glycosyltransferase [uncultured Hyphomicrobium sp.]|uniref:glycosyltransferase n=1 Tax=uncultured Hyphomicrobium sp. TaxID=194373 RepID=UPI0025CD26C0|nr:glycosyltransferase [uncultured Hyphomicrobium sp.]